MPVMPTEVYTGTTAKFNEIPTHRQPKTPHGGSTSGLILTAVSTAQR